MTTPTFQRGPITREVNVAVTVARLVEPDLATQKVKMAALTSLKVLGIATNQGIPTSTSQDPTLVSGGTSVMLSPIPANIGVASEGVWRMEYGAAASWGDRLKSGANGVVQPWVSGTDSPAAIIGRCEEPAGVAGAGSFGLVKLTL